MTQIVADSSPLISLAAAGYLPLLNQIVDEVCVPDRVWEECVQQGSGRPGADEIARTGWIRVVSATDTSYIQTLHLELDLGESEAIALARQLAVPVLMDERRGRVVASREGVTVIGTAGVLLRLKADGVLPAVRPVIDALMAAGWRVSNALLEAVLQSAGEATP